MDLSVKKLLELPILKNASVVAGTKGIDRLITSVAFIEAPDSVNWITENDFLITNTYLIMVDKDIRCSLIQKLADSKAAAIGIKLDRFLKCVPAEMIEAANRLSFPIITLPYDVTPSQIIKLVTTENVKKNVFHELQNHFRQNFFYELLYSKYETKEVLVKEAAALGLNLEMTYGLLVVKASGPDLTQKILPLIGLVENRKDSLVFELNDEIVFLLVINNPNRAKSELLSVANSLKQKCYEYFSDIPVTIGIGRYYEDLTNLQKSYSEAKNAILLGTAMNRPPVVIHYDNLGIYRILCDDKQKLQQFYDETVARIVNYDKANGTDYYNTIDVFFKNNCSNSDTARAMYLHVNTVRYRMEMIKTLFDIDTNDPDKKLNIQIGLKIARLI